MKRQKYDARRILVDQLGFYESDADSLLRLANRLHRWHELECGTDQGAIARDDHGALQWYDNRRHVWTAYHGPDYETTSLARLRKIMSDPLYKSKGFGYYVQGDPRGCALYILRPGDVPEGADLSAYYSRGIAIYKE